MPFPLKYTAFPGGSDSKVSACHVGDPGFILGLGRWPGEWNGNPLQCSSWRIPWTGERGGLQPTGSHTVGHDWGANTFTFMYRAVACQLQACCSLLFFVIQDLESCQPHLSLTSRFPTGFHQQGPQKETGRRGKGKTGVFSHFLALAGDGFPVLSELTSSCLLKNNRLPGHHSSLEVRTPAPSGFFLQFLTPANFNLFSLLPTLRGGRCSP